MFSAHQSMFNKNEVKSQSLHIISYHVLRTPSGNKNMPQLVHFLGDKYSPLYEKQIFNDLLTPDPSNCSWLGKHTLLPS